jgi:hypothetical protein
VLSLRASLYNYYIGTWILGTYYTSVKILFTSILLDDFWEFYLPQNRNIQNMYVVIFINATFCIVYVHTYYKLKIRRLCR